MSASLFNAGPRSQTSRMNVKRKGNIMKATAAKTGSGARGIADAHFDFASDFLGLSESVKTFLRTPFRVVQVTVPITMDDGLLQLFAGYRVQHSDLHTPMMGGIRHLLGHQEQERRRNIDSGSHHACERKWIGS
jgi:glutamate dehydrogenase/leucine dehydrogenase